MLLASKTGKKSGNKQNKTPVVSKKKAKKTLGQAALQAGAMYLSGNPLGAASVAAQGLYDTAYSYLGESKSSPSGLATQRVVKPLAQGTVVSRSGTSDYRIVSHNTFDDTVVISGGQEVMELYVNTGSYTVKDLNGNVYTLTEGAGFFDLKMILPGTTYSGAAGSVGNPSFTTPSKLYLFNQMYAQWRYEKIRFTYIPIRPTSEAGSISLSWNPIPSAEANITSALDIFGQKPTTPLVQSQSTYFVHTPQYQSVSMEVLPRKHGICENVKDWMHISAMTNTNTYAITSASSANTQCGSFCVNMDGFATPLANYVCGYIKLDYVISYHSALPRMNPQTYYAAVLMDPLNSDLLELVVKRYRSQRLAAEGKSSDGARGSKTHDDEDSVIVPRPTLRRRESTLP